MLNWFMDWRLKRFLNAHNKERQAMLKVISKHGMKAHKYFPSVGKRDDVELSTALDWFAENGFVVTDKNGGIVGKVSTANMDRSELADLRRSEMKLVESASSDAPDVFGASPDANGKTYKYFVLIGDGELKGMYRPILTFGQSEYRNAVRDSEMADIIVSGFHIHVIDPKHS